MMMKIYSAVTNPTDSLSKINSKISDSYPNLHKNLVDNYTNLSDTFNSNYSAISNKFNETYPNFSSGLTNTRSTITSTINNGTGYIFSLPTSIGDTVNSYASIASMLEPVDPEDKEVARIPPNESLADNVIPLQADRERIIHSVLDLYSCKPTKESFDVYNDDVIFDEPFIYSTGLSDIKSHFYGMQKFFVKSTTSEYKILENTPNVLKISLKQKYVLPYVSRAAVYNSEITLELSENKITKHIDRWNGEEGVFRRVVVVRKGVGKLFTFLVSVPDN